MITVDQIDALTGHHLIGADGTKIGKIGQVYLDDTTGRPEWVTVSTGLFGTSESFVPLAEATTSGDDLRVGYDKEKVKGAPRAGDDGHLSPQEEDELYRYYGLAASGQQTGTTTSGRVDEQAGERSRRDRSGERGVVGHDTSGPTTDDAMTRSEETLRVGTQVREAGRARLRKHVVTERQTVAVAVSHEEVVVTREPITAGTLDAATGGPAISEEVHEVVLHEEVPVVSKEVHAVERVRLGTQTVTEQQQVTEDVRKEQIEMETTGTGTGTDTRTTGTGTGTGTGKRKR